MTREGQTATTSREKWSRNPDLAFRQTRDEKSDIFRWILGRSGFATPAELTTFLAGKRRILDAGCGNGRVTGLVDRCATRFEECREWFARAGLEVTWEHVHHYGITMRGRRPGA